MTAILRPVVLARRCSGALLPILSCLFAEPAFAEIEHLGSAVLAESCRGNFCDRKSDHAFSEENNYTITAVTFPTFPDDQSTASLTVNAGESELHTTASIAFNARDEARVTSCGSLPDESGQCAFASLSIRVNTTTRIKVTFAGSITVEGEAYAFMPHFGFPPFVFGQTLLVDKEVVISQNALFDITIETAWPNNGTNSNGTDAGVGSWDLTIRLEEADDCSGATSGCTVNNTPNQPCIGTDNADVIVGTAGNDVICGLGGNDDIAGGAVDDNIFGGYGDDAILGGRG
jgi:Ca2+-binding RTX toxin-like protein